MEALHICVICCSSPGAGISCDSGVWRRKRIALSLLQQFLEYSGVILLEEQSLMC